MNLTNLLRDLTHVTPGAGFIGLGSTVRTIGSQININTDGVVHQVSASNADGNIQAGQKGTTSQWVGTGLYMSQPIVDATPYRVKAYVTTHLCEALVIVGYAPNTPTGTNDLITDIVSFPLTAAGTTESAKFDEIILMPGLSESDPDYGKPIAIGLAFMSANNAAYVRWNISAQNLSKTAPQFAASMS